MGELKKHQAPMTIEEQIENLKEIGLVVADDFRKIGKSFCI